MDDLLAKFGSVARNLQQHDEVKGKVVSITPERMVVNIGGKNEGIVAEKAYKEAKDYIAKLKVGDEITANVIVPETYDGFTILSLRKASQGASWGKISEALKDKKPIKVHGVSLNQAGIMVSVEGLSGFLPLSQLGIDAAKNPNSLVNTTFEAIPIEVDMENNKVVISERMVSDSDLIEKIDKAMEKIKVGEVYKGDVCGIASFGCFVTIYVKIDKEEIPVDGLVHLSELAWEKVGAVSDVVSEGDKVEVKVLGKDNEKLSLSIKHAKADPWDNAAKNYKKDQKVKGVVTRVGEYGVFVQLEPGIDGLIHLTKIPHGEKMEKGKEVEVYIEDIDVKEKKISLGLVLTAIPVGYK